MRSPEDLRHNLAQAILHVRSQRATSRRSLADVMRLSPTTAGFYVDQLIAFGHLRESGLEQGLMGRPKRALSTEAAAGWFAGIEFNAERMQAVRVDFSGTLAASALRPLPEGAHPREVITEIKNLIAALMRGASGPLLGIGLGAPGVVDPQRGVGVDYAFFPDWKNVPLAVPLSKRFKVPVTLENNLRAIALAERWFGGGRDLNDYVILGPRSGFGIAMMQGGRLTRGAHHAAGEIGLWPWPSAGGEKSKKLHHALSSPAIWRRLAGASSRMKLPVDLHRALGHFADASGAAYGEVIADYARVIGCLHLLVDTEVYFLHGPLTALGASFCDAVAGQAATLMGGLKDHPLHIVPSTLGDDAGALGAASLAMETWIPKQ